MALLGSYGLRTSRVTTACHGALMMNASNVRDDTIPHDNLEGVLNSFTEWMNKNGMTARKMAQNTALGRKENVPGNLSHVSRGRSSNQASIESPRLANTVSRSNDKPSFAWRIFKTMIYGFIIVTIAGVIWLANRDADRTTTMATWAKASARWLSSTPATGSSSSAPGLITEPTAKSINQPPQQTASTADSANQAPHQTASTADSAKVSAELLQQLQTMASDLATVHRAVEQLARKQDLMAQDVSSLLAAQQNVSQKLSSLAQAQAAAKRAAAQKKPPDTVHSEAPRQPPSAPPPSALPPSPTPPAATPPH